MSLFRNRFFIMTKSSRQRAFRQLTPVVAACVLLTACSSDDTQRGTIGFVEGYPGGIAADEPQAAQIGLDVLTAGGSAVDAAVAAYFTLAVTMPSSASLGGGGTCVVFDPARGKPEAIDFLARPPAVVPAGADRPTAVPGNVRGMFAMHAKYGVLPWAQLIGPAETLARLGTPVSRAFAADLKAVEAPLMAEPTARRVFGRPDGSGALREGDTMVQYELAAVMARLRRLGAGDLYAGETARRLVVAANDAGGSLTDKDLRDTAPVWVKTIRVPMGNNAAHFAPPPAAAGGVEAEMLAMLIRDDAYADADPGERRHLLAETAMRAFGDRARWLGADGLATVDPQDIVAEKRIDALMRDYSAQRHTPATSLSAPPERKIENPAATSFVAIDRYGMAASCALTMNGLFGTGRIAEGTGILLAALPGPGGRGPTSLGPVVVVNEPTKSFFFAGAASGGVSAPTALINVLMDAFEKKQLTAAMKAFRIHHGGFPDMTFYEHGLDDAAIKDLAARGHRLAPTPSLARVNAAYCPYSLPDKPDTCAVMADPRGLGLGTTRRN